MAAKQRRRRNHNEPSHVTKWRTDGR